MLIQPRPLHFRIKTHKKQMHFKVFYDYNRNMDIESIIVQRIQHIDDRIDIDEGNLTPIQEFYKDTKVFVTGFTGFMGQILVEKLLRSCPVSTIYLLIRSKKGKDVETRLNDIFDDPLFNRMKKACPEFRKKIVTIQGDCVFPDLGVGVQDKKLLINEVDIIFHVAATVRFDEHLKTATAINVRATRDLSELAKQMKKIKSFVHVSTAYSNLNQDVIEEKIYPPPISYKHLINITETTHDNLLDKMTPRLIETWPNTYSYTKQIAEDVVKENLQGLPTNIYRPSIVVSTYMEPVRGWINNIYGVTGALMASGLGLVRVFHCDEDAVANIIPVDMCVNGLIVSAWDVAQRFQRAKENGEPFEIPVYNYESSNDKVIHWKRLKKLVENYTLITPSFKCIWYYTLFLVKSYKLYKLLVLLLHLLPATIVDAILICSGREMKMLNAYKKIYKFSAVISYFSTRTFPFKSMNIKKMVARMTDRDQNIFFCDLRQLDWDEFFKTYGLGARVYLVKDPIETLPEAKKRYQRLKWAHETVKLIIAVLVTTILYFLLSAIYNYMFA